MDLSPTRPEVSILSNSPALNALKRQQLIGLAKQHGLKASGKNVELIAKLKKHGERLAHLRSQSARGEGPEGEQEAGEGSWMVLGDEQLDRDVEEDATMQDLDEQGQELVADVDAEMTEFGAVNASSSMPCSTSSSSLASTIRSVGGSLARRFKSASNLASSSSHSSLSTSSHKNMLVDPPTPPRPLTPKIYPSLSPTSLASYSPRQIPTADRPGVLQMDDTSSVFDSSTMNSSSPAPTLSGGIRLVSRPTDVGLAAPSLPLLAPAEQVTFVPVPNGTTHVASLASPSSNSSTGLEPGRFIFGSPAAKESTFTFSLSFAPARAPLFAASTSATREREPGMVRSKSTAELVVEEMNRRAQQSLADSGGPADDAPWRSTLLSASGSTSKKVGDRGMFAGAHKRVFDRMQGIDTHYAAKRPTMGRSMSSTQVAQEVDEETPRKKPKLGMSGSSSFGRLALATSASRMNLAAKGMMGTERHQSPEKVANALRGGGWCESMTTTARGSSRVGLASVKKSSEEEREATRRRLQMVKQRRQSAETRMRKKRVSLGPAPKTPCSTTKKLLRSTLNKVNPSSLTSRPPPVSVVPSALSRSTTTMHLSSAPKPASASASIAASSLPGPGWKKFDLQASLKRKPVGYAPKLGSLTHASNSSRIPSTASARPSTSVTASTLSSASKQQQPGRTHFGASSRANAADSPVRKIGSSQGKMMGSRAPSHRREGAGKDFGVVGTSRSGVAGKGRDENSKA